MKKYIIERHVPGAGNMTVEELQAISKTSNAVVALLGRPYVWVQSFVTENKIYCVHEAENEDDIREHAKCADIPVSVISEIKVVIGPGTASENQDSTSGFGDILSYSTGLCALCVFSSCSL